MVRPLYEDSWVTLKERGPIDLMERNVADNLDNPRKGDQAICTQSPRLRRKSKDAAFLDLQAHGVDPPLHTLSRRSVPLTGALVPAPQRTPRRPAR
jgi:hypothetical protein